jgi:hypothetical protein
MDESYASSTVAFEIDSSSEQLSAKPPKEISENEHVESLLDFHKWDITARVIGVHQGEYGGEPATLVLFEFRFDVSGGKRSRLSSSKITTTFEPAQTTSKKRQRPKDNKSNKYPNVKLYSPDTIQGPVTKIQKVDVTGIDLALIKPSPSFPILPQIGFTRTSTETYWVDTMMEINGSVWRSRDRCNQAIWELKEGLKHNKGIPKVLKAAVVLQNGGQPFQATVEVKAHTGMGLPLEALPWSDPTPLFFKTDVSFGPSLRSSNFDELTEDDFTRLCEFSGEISVSQGHLSLQSSILILHSRPLGWDPQRPRKDSLRDEICKS